ncbi:fatty acid hydroperoxide lyase, chloroplastic [Impatiens glandulifera]|uniref:fatty acid hydroperoxide lyase, chloroplastic n=1 Tax=Impatiens glandulifera TaxID=253017 RepID=UPI001FB0B2F4|nr:fatty acid hydroperoxide lyase, chloroplastic [Impatiens glandulifera]
MSAMIATMMSVSPGIPPRPAIQTSPSSTSVPMKTIPGDYGWPLIGAIGDRLDYFWFQGAAKFYQKRMEKHQSTVFRTNVPPSFPFFTGVNPNVVAVLDCKSFSYLFDMELVEKKNILVGDFMPSVDYTGGIRVCAYLDTDEDKHSKIKRFAMDILKRSSSIWVPTLSSKLDTMWDTIESSLSSSTSVSYLVPVQKFLFSFFCRSLAGADTSLSPDIDENGYIKLDLWLALQTLPTVPIGLFQPLEEIFLHSWAYPAFLVSNGYNQVADFIEKEGAEVIQRAQTEFGLSTKEAIHNLVFMIGFNAYGGFSLFIPYLLGALGNEENKGVQERLRKEVRENIGSGLSFESVKKMDLVQSFVYETMRLNPPVPTQYGRARKDFILSSYESSFEVKKGELLCGYQPLVMKDPNVFEEPDKFKADRFTGEKGRELLNYLFWSNGPQTGSPSESNKQCAGKDYVTLTGSLFLAYLFQRYDSIGCDGSSITTLKKAGS